MRQIALDTDTTGLSAETGDRITELAFVDLTVEIPKDSINHAKAAH